MSSSLVAEIPAKPRIERRIGQVLGKKPGPTLICIGSLHGNEPAGYRALDRVFATLEAENVEVRGEFLGLVGNCEALRQGKRFLNADLNRHWAPQRVAASRVGALAHSPVPEDLELHELRQVLEAAFGRARGEVYVLDLHTTSGGGPAFVVMSDTLRNRKFTLQFPAPIIVGLEEELEGTLTDYVMDLGHIAIGFEGGQHDEPHAVNLCEAGAWIALSAAGIIDAEKVPQVELSRQFLVREKRGLPKVFEVRYRHPVDPDDGFRMEPGFVSFQKIRKGELLARDRHRELRAQEDGRILMPLYQKQGEDGYFEMRHFSPFWLRLSALLRRGGLDRVINWLPGVERDPDHHETLRIDRKVARWYSLQLFHLLGYRRHRSSGDQLVVTRRQHDFPIKSVGRPGRR
ncbi:MAG: succinylglutamate desuccinylase/aspartoacylase family protein [Acidobacteriota bacterium]|nr:succinylglutamate desuccinylase/aspartoacylase family protein [Acidobacteriota bacterium]